jgi:AraC family transcriptional regulator, regulatory protein of adaptative response / methylated-DNA-[protein]-cysteine methyltransferase
MLQLISALTGNLVMRGDNQFWRGVLERDRALDGRFVFAVRSTGIYCRPSCPARRPRRQQVVFFPLPEAAEQAGYRACRRCRPRQTAPGDPAAALVHRVCQIIDTDSESPLSLARLSETLGVSEGHLQKTFKRVMGISPREFAEARRVASLKTHLRAGHDVARALYTAGYGASSRLYEKSAVELGMTPGAYRRGGKGMKIAYTIVNCPLGRMLLAATDRGISALTLGDSDSMLEAALVAEYSQAEIHRDDARFTRWTQMLERHLKGVAPRLDLPLDVQATAFQRRVWKELQKIPYGETRTYTQVARAIGKPRAIRAVARACATNPVSVIVPCHRVIREDGSLAGYRWGLQRKEALQKLERNALIRANR